MKNVRHAAAWAALAVVAIGPVVACAPKGAPRQTDLMEKSGAVRASSSELRIRVNALADSMSSRIELLAERIRAESRDADVRRRALVLEIDALPAVYGAAYRTDPLVSALDLWALALQLDHYMEAGAGRDAFGDHQPLAREAASELVKEVDAVMSRIAIGPERVARARARLAAWVKDNPIQGAVSSRPSVAAFMAELHEGRDAFAAVGAASDALENLSERMNSYATQLPKQARLQAELLIQDSLGEQSLEAALRDLRAVGAAAQRANDLLAEADIAGSSASLRDAISAERLAVAEALDRQRAQILQYATEERLAALATLHEERLQMVSAIRQERIEALKEVDAIKTRGVQIALAGLRDLVDYALWHAALLLALFIVAGAVLVIVGRRLVPGRRGDEGRRV